MISVNGTTRDGPPLVLSVPPGHGLRAGERVELVAGERRWQGRVAYVGEGAVRVEEVARARR